QRGRAATKRIITQRPQRKEKYCSELGVLGALAGVKSESEMSHVFKKFAQSTKLATLVVRSSSPLVKGRGRTISGINRCHKARSFGCAFRITEMAVRFGCSEKFTQAANSRFTNKSSSKIAGEKEGRRKFFDEVAIFVPSA
ncbi:MAG TPA: hypothetical protein VFO00_03475, partial [Vitreimonas sp.]|nr:hypothetical protein [Vitreimonas sp.]